MPQALSRIRVLDLSRSVAGAYCAKLLADYGAGVVRVEDPRVSDSIRGGPPFLSNENTVETSSYHLYLNTNKKSITLDLASDEGKNILVKLAGKMDIVLHTFTPGTKHTLGMLDVFAHCRNDSILVEITNFGQTGPYRNRNATELELLALSGLLHIAGDREKPVKMGGFQAQYIAGLKAFTATCAALFKRARTGEGQHIDIAVLENILDLFFMQSGIFYTYLGIISKRKFFTRFVTGHPIGLYRCKDGYVVVIAGLGGMPNLAIMLGDPELEHHPWFKSAWARQEHAAEFDETFLKPWLKDHGRDEIVGLAQELRMPFGSLMSPRELLSDTHLAARKFFTSVTHPAAGNVVFPGAPFKSGRTDWRPGRAPTLGEHNSEVYGTELGYSREDLTALVERGVI